MIARLEIERGRLANVTKLDEVFLAARGHAINNDVLDAPHRLCRHFFGGGDGVLGGLHLFGEALGLRHERGFLVFRRLCDLFAEGVLFGAQGFKCRDRGAAIGISRQSGIDGLGRRTSCGL